MSDQWQDHVLVEGPFKGRTAREMLDMWYDRRTGDTISKAKHDALFKAPEPGFEPLDWGSGRAWASWFVGHVGDYRPDAPDIAPLKAMFADREVMQYYWW